MDDRHVGIGRMNFWKGYDPFNGTSGGENVFTPLTQLEPLSFNIARSKEITGNFQADGLKGDPLIDGVSVKRFGKYEIVTMEAENYNQAGTAPEPPDDLVPPVPDKTCCDSLYADYWSLMNSGEKQVMSAQPSLYGCIYLWEIVECNPWRYFCGQLTHHPAGSTARGVIYTAPTIPESAGNCEQSVSVKFRLSVLQSDGPDKKANDKGPKWNSVDLIAGIDELPGRAECHIDFMVSVQGPECARPNYCLGYNSILFTTQSMLIDEEQTLSASNSLDADKLSWSLSGGGSISSTQGPSTVYTAPSSNSNCSSSAIIFLMCNGIIVDTLQINITNNSTSHAGSVCKLYNVGNCVTAGGKYYVYVTCQASYINCDGSESEYCLWNAQSATGAATCDQAIINSYNYASGLCVCHYSGWSNIGKVYDGRTEEQKLNGCCPPQML